MDFVLAVDHIVKVKVKVKENETLDKYLNLTWAEKMWKMKVTTPHIKSARIIRRVLEIWEDLLSHRFLWKTVSWSWCDKISSCKAIMIIWNLTIRTNSICATQNLSWRMRHTLFSGILRYKRIISFRPDDQTKFRSTKKRDLAEFWTLLSRQTIE